MKQVVLFLVGLLTTTYTFGQGTFNTSGLTSDYSVATSWTLISGSDADGIPDSDDNINILAGHDITVSSNEACDGLTITDDGSISQLTIDAGNTLSVGGTLSGSTAANNAELLITVNGTLAVAGTMRIQSTRADVAIELTIGNNGSMTIASGGTSYIRLRNAETDFSFIDNSGTFDCNGRLQFWSTRASDFVIDNHGTFNVGDDLRFLTDDATSSLDFNNRGTLDIDGDFQLDTRADAAAADNMLDMKFLDNTVNLAGAITMLNLGGTIDCDATNATFEYDAASAQTIVTDTRVEYHNLTITGAKTATLDGPLPAAQCLGDITVNIGATFDHDEFAVTTTGDFTNASGTITQDGTLTIGGSYSNNGTGTHNATTHNFVTGNFTNIGAYNATSSNLDIGGNYNNSGTYTSASGGSNINVAGDWANTGTYTAISGDIVEMDGTSGTASITGTTTFMGLNIDHTGTGVTNSGTVNIQENLDLDNGTYTTGGATTLLSNAVGTGNFDNMNSATLSGDLTLQRRINAAEDGWRELASPFTATTINDWQSDGMITSGFPNSSFPNFGFISVWTYNENNADGDKNNGWTSATNATNTISADSGNRVYIGTGIMSLDLAGTPNQGDYTWNLAYQDDAGDSEQEGWNLIGNPYPCTVDFDLIGASDRTNMEYRFYVFSASSGNYGSYTGQVGGSGTNGVDRYIPSMQGFWVHATAAGSSLTFREDDKVGTEDPSFVKNAVNDQFFRIKMTGDQNSYQDEAVIIINDNATSGVYDNLDSYKLYAPSDYANYSPSLALVLDDSVDLTTMSFAHDASYTIPFKALAGQLAQGQYTLDFSNLDEFQADACVQLEDLHLGTMTDLRANPAYTFASSDTTTAPRFVIHVNSLIDDMTSTDASCDGMTDGNVIVEVTAGNSFDFVWMDGSSNVIQTSAGVMDADTLSNIGAGTYYLTSNGGACFLGANEFVINAPEAVIAAFNSSADTIYLSDGGNIDFTNLSTGATGYAWDFGDANTSNAMDPMHTYTVAGQYTVTLTAENGEPLCDDMITQDITVLEGYVGIDESALNGGFSVYQDETKLYLDFDLDEATDVHIEIVNLLGKVVLDPMEQEVRDQTITIAGMERMSAGVYFAVVTYNGQRFTQKVQWSK